MYQKQCKVCNSYFKNIIEELGTKQLNPRKIIEYLESIQDPEQQAILAKEDLHESAIRRHLTRHFMANDVNNIKVAEKHSKIELSRKKLESGTKIIVDKVNTLCYFIDVSLIKMEELEVDDTIRNKDKYSFFINLMQATRGVITDLAKLTGELQQEGTIDINYFSNEIDTFANIVLRTIQALDKRLDLNGTLETEFSTEFTKQWQDYKELQDKVLTGELPAHKRPESNTFNEGV